MQIRIFSCGALLLVGCAEARSEPVRAPETPAASTPEAVRAAPPASAPPPAPTRDAVPPPNERRTEGLEVTLALPPGTSPLALRFRVHNPTAEPKTFCDYHTPFEGIRNDIFEVKDSKGSVVPYQGMMAKRVPPSAENYVHLQPGQSKETSVDLGKGYTLTPGSYRVRFSGNGISGLGPSNEVSLRAP